MSVRARDVGLIAAAVVLFAAAIALQAVRDSRFPRDTRQVDEVLYIRSGPAAKRMTLSFNALAADLYWIRAIQYYGGDRLSGPQSAAKYRLLYPLLDLTTTLDPYFSIAYRFGSIFLGEPYPGGPGRPDEAVALLEKGLTAQPAKWQYMQDLGFVYYWHLRDFNAAASAFQRAADMPGAPSWLRPLAAVTLAEGGNRKASRALWQQLAQSEEPWLSDAATLRLAQLDAMEVMEAWRNFRRQRGVTPPLPLDPSGTPFAIDPLTGDITVARESKLFPLPGQIQAPR